MAVDEVAMGGLYFEICCGVCFEKPLESHFLKSGSVWVIMLSHMVGKKYEFNVGAFILKGPRSLILKVYQGCV